MDDNLATAFDAAGKDLIVISSSISSSALLGLYKDTAVPAITWESALFDDMGMTGGVLNTDHGELSGKSTLAIANAAHPLAAGLSGTRSVHTSGQVVKWGRPAAAAARVATIAGDATRPAIFGYDAGAAMTSGVGPGAPGRLLPARQQPDEPHGRRLEPVRRKRPLARPAGLRPAPEAGRAAGR